MVCFRLSTFLLLRLTLPEDNRWYDIALSYEGRYIYSALGISNVGISSVALLWKNTLILSLSSLRLLNYEPWDNFIQDSSHLEVLYIRHSTVLKMVEGAYLSTSQRPECLYLMWDTFFFDVWNSNHDTIIAMVQFWFNPATGEGEQNYCASRSIARANCHLFSSRYLLKSSSVRAPAPQSLSEKLTGMFFAVSLFSHSSECGFIDFLLPHESRLRFQSLPWEWTSQTKMISKSNTWCRL